MLATGEALERYAQGRAHRELTALLGRAPRDVQRYVDGRLETTPIEAVAPGDLLAIRPGEVVPVDGMVVGSPAVLDESALTGESRQVTREEGDPVSSGTVNAGLIVRSPRHSTAADSAYAGIVRLVQEAQHSKAPFVRLADRYALIFVPFTLGDLRGSLVRLRRPRPRSRRPGRGDAVPAPARRADRDRRRDLTRRAARRDRQGRWSARDPGTGSGHAVRQDRNADRRPAKAGLRSTSVQPRSPGPSIKARSSGWPASVEQLSPHVLAGSIVHGARRRGLELSMPDDVVETPGRRRDRTR